MEREDFLGRVLCARPIIYSLRIAFDCHANCVVLIEQVLFGRLLVKST